MNVYAIKDCVCVFRLPSKNSHYNTNFSQKKSWKVWQNNAWFIQNFSAFKIMFLLCKIVFCESIASFSILQDISVELFLFFSQQTSFMQLLTKWVKLCMYRSRRRQMHSLNKECLSCVPEPGEETQDIEGSITFYEIEETDESAFPPIPVRHPVLLQ